MCHMRRVNMRELHHRTGAIVDLVIGGDIVLIEKRGTPVAEIRPLPSRAKGIPAEHWDFLRKFPRMKDDSGRLISDDRSRG